MIVCTAVHCDNCGSPLDVPEAANFVSCQHCGSGLAVYRTDTVVYTEQIEKLARQTEQAVTRLQQRLDLEDLDRKWDSKRRRFGSVGVPNDRTAGPNPITAVCISLYLCFALSFLLYMGTSSHSLWLAVVGGTVLFVMYMLAGKTDADVYCRARDSYLKRRANLMSQNSIAEHSDMT